MNGFGSSSLNPARSRFVKPLEKSLTRLFGVVRFANGNAYAIPPCIFPKDIIDRGIYIEFRIKVFLRFKSCADIVRKLVHAFSRFQGGYARPHILANCFSWIVRGFVLEDDNGSNSLGVIRQF